jgi:hypothetical protein
LDEQGQREESKQAAHVPPPEADVPTPPQPSQEQRAAGDVPGSTLLAALLTGLVISVFCAEALGLSVQGASVVFLVVTAILMRLVARPHASGVRPKRATTPVRTPSIPQWVKIAVGVSLHALAFPLDRILVLLC